MRIASLLFSITLISFGVFAGTFYVSANAIPGQGDGSIEHPWATLTDACREIPDDGSTVLVADGTYDGIVMLNRRFANHTFFKASNPYRAVLINSSRTQQVIISFGGANFTIEGFEIRRPDPSAQGVLIMQIQSKSKPAENITIRNNIFHDSFNNDLLKINNGSREILVEGNVFYNQSGPDEHIDINSVSFVTVQDNIFFNDFKGSKRPVAKDTGSFIVIKDSSERKDSREITLRRNIFLNWEGSPERHFVLIGEDGKPFHEAEDVLIENNLMLGNSARKIRSAFGVKGAKNIVFRNNTVVGDLPSFAFAMRLNREGANPVNKNIRFYNNIWSDPTGTMEHFSDGLRSETKDAILDNNLYYNGGNLVPNDDKNVLPIAQDSRAIIADPRLGKQNGLILPRWDSNGYAFLSGRRTIREEFERLVALYGFPEPGSPAMNAADPRYSPSDDILGNERDKSPDLGAVEVERIIQLGSEIFPIGFVGVPYSHAFEAKGGLQPYKFAVLSGNIPQGLTLTKTGSLSGIPVIPGTYSFTIEAKDAYGNKGSSSFTIRVITFRTAG